MHVGAGIDIDFPGKYPIVTNQKPNPPLWETKYYFWHLWLGIAGIKSVLFEMNEHNSPGWVQIAFLPLTLGYKL